MDPWWLLLIVPGSVMVGVFSAYYANTYKGMDATPSCGCILCDLKVERQYSHLGYFHQTQHGFTRCDRLN